MLVIGVNNSTTAGSNNVKKNGSKPAG